MAGGGLNVARRSRLKIAARRPKAMHRSPPRPTTVTAPNPSSPAAGPVAVIAREIDLARQRGPLQQIVVPPCPELLTRLDRAMAHAEPDLGEVARIAEADVAMAATLIRHANGARYAGAAPVALPGQAMNRLGLRQTATLMRGFLASHAIPVRSPLLAGFWEQSTQRAQAMAWIAMQLPGLSVELAHSYGLFCHVGQPVLLQSVRGYAGTLVEARARKDRSAVETENANHRTDHAVVGALTARCWHLPGPVMAAIRLHHNLESLGHRDIEPEVQTLVAAGLVADWLVARRQGLSPDADWTRHRDAALAWLGVAADELDAWVDASFEEALAPA